MHDPSLALESPPASAPPAPSTQVEPADTCPSCGATFHRGARFCASCGAELVVAAARETRRVVTIFFCDITGSTSLGEQIDAEVVRRVMLRYAEESRAVVERHGGTVEKFIGDAMMAVFGVPILHEDDALRAVRAAAELRTRLAELNDELQQEFSIRLAYRMGLNTGEVVAGTDGRLATGDAVNVAARLEQAADPGDVLLGDQTLRLVHDAVEAESLTPLVLKGKSDPILAHRLIGVRRHVPPTRRRSHTPLVGRRAELAELRSAYERTLRTRACHLFTVLGDAGVGKSRLAAEFASSTQDATVAVGRCLSYGEGITYLPVVDVVQQLLGDDLDPALRDLVGDDAVRAAILALTDESRQPSSTDETAWAVRKLFEALAARRPLVVVFDDLHWGEQTFLDLVEHIADWSRNAPILLVCLARPDLLDVRRGWGGGKLNASTVLLEPLSAEETDELIARLVRAEPIDTALRTRIQRSAEGYPLYVEQMLALIESSRSTDVVVPPSIQALLAARLDQLEPRERAVLEHGAVEGRIFHRGAVAALTPDEREIDLQLMSLVRKEFVRPHAARIAGDDAFRFRHELIRDAAYEAVPKQVRAELHERLSDWIRAGAGSDELVGYHLESAHHYRTQLGQGGDQARALGVRAGAFLGSAGRRALARGDVGAATNLLGRAAALLPTGDELRNGLLPDLGAALREAGDIARAQEILEDALEHAERTGDRVARFSAMIELAKVYLLNDPRAAETERIVADVENTTPILERLAEDRILARAWTLIGIASSLWKGLHRRGEEALERALVHARRAHDRQQEAAILGQVGLAATWGPTPVPAAIARCEELSTLARGHPAAEAYMLRFRASLEARQGRLDEGRELATAAREAYEELGMLLMVEVVRAFASADIELLADDYDAAERDLRTAYRALERMGAHGYCSTVAAFLARALYGQNRQEEALAMAHRSEDLAASYDLWSQVIARGPHAKALASRGSFDEAEAVAREAVALVEATDTLELHGRALMDLAIVLQLSGAVDEAFRMLSKAVALFERKEISILVSAAQAVLTEQG